MVFSNFDEKTWFFRFSWKKKEKKKQKKPPTLPPGWGGGVTAPLAPHIYVPHSISTYLQN